MLTLSLTLLVLAIASAAIVVLYRRFKRAAPGVPRACHVSAAFALVWGVLTTGAGFGHSYAVASLAYRMHEYGPLQVLWLTTGAMLLYAGGSNAALYGGLKAGRKSAIGMAGATSSLFVLYLLFVNPLPGGGGSVPTMLAAWSLYILSLAAAGVAVIRWTPDARIAA